MEHKALTKDAVHERESLTDLLSQLASNSAAVVHDEIELVIQKGREKVRLVRSGVVTMAVAGVIGFAAFLVFCTALIIWLAYYMDLVFAVLVAGVALAVVGIIVAYIGYQTVMKAIPRDESDS